MVWYSSSRETNRNFIKFHEIKKPVALIFRIKILCNCQFSVALQMKAGSRRSQVRTKNRNDWRKINFKRVQSKYINRDKINYRNEISPTRLKSHMTLIQMRVISEKLSNNAKSDKHMWRDHGDSWKFTARKYLQELLPETQPWQQGNVQTCLSINI